MESAQSAAHELLKQHCRNFLEKASLIFADFARDFSEYGVGCEAHKDFGSEKVPQKGLIAAQKRQFQTIKNFCAGEINSFMNLCKSELIQQFLQYARNDLAADVSKADIQQFRKKFEREIVIEKLIIATDFALTAKIKLWLSTRGNQLYRQAVNKIQVTLSALITTKFFAALPGDLQASAKAPVSAAIQLGEADNKMLKAGGLMAGSGIAGFAAALLLPARFLIFAGPLGWIIGGLLTVLGAGLVFWNNKQQHRKLVEAYIVEAHSMIIKKAPEWAEAIALEAANNLGEALLPFLINYERQLRERSKTEDIAMLQKAVQNCRTTRALINAYAIKIQNLQKEWNEIMKKTCCETLFLNFRTG